MGYYIQGPTIGKADHIVAEHGGEFIGRPSSFSDIASDKALICVIFNGPFDAACFVHDEREFEDCKYPDGRMRRWLIMDRALAVKLSNFPES